MDDLVKDSHCTAPNLEVPLDDIAEIFVRDLVSFISYFWLRVRNLVAYENHARIPVFVTWFLRYESKDSVRKFETLSTKFLRVRKFLRQYRLKLRP